MRLLTPEQMEKPRKHRPRRKLCLSEFQESGFSLELTYDRNALSHGDVLDHLIGSIKTQDRVFSGGDSPEQAEINGYLCLTRVGSLDEADRESARLWLEAQPWYKAFEVGPLSDCQHSFFK